jgi:cyclophilin family peptidyl-prolyl cis-trans isomerase
VAKSTHEKQLERARARRDAERADQRRARTVVVTVVVALLVFVGALAAVLALRGGDDQDPAVAAPASDVDAGEDQTDAEAIDEATPSEGDPVPCPAPTGDVPQPPAEPYAAQPTTDLGGLDSLTATLTTTCGDIVLELAAAEAPATVANFVALAEDGYYAGVPFHRVIDGFMIQGGDPTGTGTGCVDAACEQRFPGYTFADELALAEQVVSENQGYPRGTLAMANAGPDTNGSQFFVVQADPSYPLPPSYAVFGSVLDGLDVVDRIALGPVEGDLAIDPVVITEVTIERCAPGDC